MPHELNDLIPTRYSLLSRLKHWDDQFRRRQVGPAASTRAGARGTDEADDRTATVDRIPDPAGSGLEAVWEAEWEKRLLTAALESVKQRVSPRQYQMFDLHVLPQSKRGRSDDYR